MAENEVIEYFKYEIKKCHEEHEGCCAMVKNGTCTCREATILSVLEKYQAIGTLYKEKCEELASFKPIDGKFYFGQQLYIKEENQNGNSKKV